MAGSRRVPLLAVAVLLIASCTSLSDYATRNAERECSQITTCTVYDQTGKHLSPCWNPPGRWGTIYPGDPQWPFEPGVCATPVASAEH
jgi:hypothetical protein